MDYIDYEAGLNTNHFFFRAKQFLLRCFLQKHISSKSGELKILILGAGTGEEIYVLQSYGKLFVVDIDKKALNLIPNDICEEKKLADACDLPYHDEMFDVIISFDVFEHIANDKQAIAECYRTLRGGGKMFFSVPAHPCLFSAHDHALHHFRRYSKCEIRKCLQHFSKVRINYWNFTFFPIISLVRLLKKKSAPKTNRFIMPRPLNETLYRILQCECFLSTKCPPLPWGLSIVGTATK